MLWVGFEPKIPAHERVKRVHVSDRTVTVIRDLYIHSLIDLHGVMLNYVNTGKTLSNINRQERCLLRCDAV
jgi:hypothetical protein